MRDEPAEGEAELRYPSRGTFVGCCASTVKQSAKNKAPSARVKIFSFIVVPSRLTSHPYRITLSARANTFGGIVKPICLAVFRLMMNSNFFGCSTGRSAGFVPLRILSTYVAARRYSSEKFVP